MSDECRGDNRRADIRSGAVQSGEGRRRTVACKGAIGGTVMMSLRIALFALVCSALVAPHAVYAADNGGTPVTPPPETEPDLTLKQNVIVPHSTEPEAAKPAHADTSAAEKDADDAI